MSEFYVYWMGKQKAEDGTLKDRLLLQRELVEAEDQDAADNRVWAQRCNDADFVKVLRTDRSATA